MVDVDGQLDVLTGLRAEGAGDGIGDEGVRTELGGSDSLMRLSVVSTKRSAKASSVAEAACRAV